MCSIQSNAQADACADWLRSESIKDRSSFIAWLARDKSDVTTYSRHHLVENRYFKGGRVVLSAGGRLAIQDASFLTSRNKEIAAVVS